MTEIVLTLPHIEGFLLFIFLSFIAHRFYIWYQDYLYRQKIQVICRSIIIGGYVGGLTGMLTGLIFPRNIRVIERNLSDHIRNNLQSGLNPRMFTSEYNTNPHSNPNTNTNTNTETNDDNGNSIPFSNRPWNNNETNITSNRPM